MDAPSPAKRRVLASLDANALSPRLKVLGKPAALPKSPVLAARTEREGRKRPPETSRGHDEVAPKKMCAERREGAETAEGVSGRAVKDTDREEVRN